MEEALLVGRLAFSQRGPLAGSCVGSTPSLPPPVIRRSPVRAPARRSFIALNSLSWRIEAATLASPLRSEAAISLIRFGAAGKRHRMGERRWILAADAVRRGVPGEAGVAGLIAPVDADLASQAACPHEASLARREQ